MRCCNNYRLTLGVVVSILLLTVGSIQAKLKTDPSKSVYQSPQVAAPLTQTRVHKVGNMWLSITNFGQIGSSGRSYRDLCTGLPAPSWEFPAGSGIDYLYWSALWIGAVVNDTDTLVSVGHDGWNNVQEFYPTSTGAIVARTIRDGGFQQDNCFIPYSDSANSELDYKAVYYDTLKVNYFGPLDPIDGRHKPLNLEVTQKSYSWSYEYANDFVLLDFLIKNIGATKLNKMYIGFYLDFDAYNSDFDGGGYTDDIAGFKLSLPSAYDPRFEDTVNIAWGADNDGLSSNGAEGIPPVFKDYISPTGVIGTRVLNSPGRSEYSFNWWVSNGNPALDFGPWTQENFARRPSLFPPNGQLGTPEGDHSKYFIMSNNEFDYDQIFAALNWHSKGWMPPQNPSVMPDIADGYDSRYLLSFGPFSIGPDDALPLTVALVAGEDFHVKPTDYLCFNPLDSAGAYCYYNRLDFTSLAANSNWAQCVYDNPGFDTDGDGYRGKYHIINGDTFFVCGDGVPDFRGPPPPPFPKLTFETSYGTVKIKWNGKKTETFRDPFTTLRDFEGYRIFGSWTGILGDFFLLDSFDKINYKLFYWDKGRKKWSYKLTDLSTDSLITLFQQDDPCLDIRPCPFETLAFCSDPGNCDDRDVARWNLYHPYIYQGTQLDTLRIAPNLTITRGDSIYFDRQDYNRGLLPIKTFKDSIIAGSIGPDDERYYEYEYVIDNLNPNEPLYFAITTFDFGDPITRLAPLETSVLTTSTLVYPRTCSARPADVNGDGEVLLSDIVAMINIRFKGAPFPQPLCRLDINGNRGITFSDIIYFVNFLFRNGPGPQVSKECCLVGN